MIHKILRYLCIYASLSHSILIYLTLFIGRYHFVSLLIHKAGSAIGSHGSPQKKLNLLVNFGIYPLVMTNIAIEHGPFIDDLS